MNCTFIFANIINSILSLFNARYAEKLVLKGCFEYDCDGDSLSICVDRLRS